MVNISSYTAFKLVQVKTSTENRVRKSIQHFTIVKNNCNMRIAFKFVFKELSKARTRLLRKMRLTDSLQRRMDKFRKSIRAMTVVINNNNKKKKMMRQLGGQKEIGERVDNVFCLKLREK